MPITPSDGEPAVGTPRRPRGQAEGSPQTHSSPSTLATGSESVFRQRCVKLGVLEAVPVGEPFIWCHPMVTAWKKYGKPRRTVDMQVLNKHAVRETHHTQSLFHQATLVLSGTKKTITDAWNGYHSVPIRKEGRHLTTFITPWGQYRYKTCPHGPPLAAQEPVYPFQCICADYFKYKGCNYTVVVDRYSGWPIVQHSRDGSSGLVECLREIFVPYGIADELSSDGEPEFTAEATQQLLSKWGVHHRFSSVALAHSNGRAELGVKTCKRMLMDNTGSNGEINLDKFQRGMLQYRNTPDRDTGLSPAQMIFGRPIKDFIPNLPGS